MRRGPFTVLLVVAMSGCGVAPIRPQLPTAPSDLTSGIAIYQDRNYQGHSAAVESDIAHLGNYDGPCNYDPDEGDTSWDDCISSIRVAPGWRAIIYADEDFQGQSLEITADVPNLKLVWGWRRWCQGLDECITSIKVLAPTGAAR